MRVKITNLAEKDLENIFDYHTTYNFSYAQTFQKEIVTFLFENLKNFPKLGVMYNSHIGVRKIIFKKYNIYYSISLDAVNILYIVHSRQSFNDLLRNKLK